MSERTTDWQRIVSIVTDLERAPESETTIKECLNLLNMFRQELQSADAVALNLMTFLFVKSVLPLLNNDQLAPSIIEGILLTLGDILRSSDSVQLPRVEAAQLVCLVLKYGIEHENERQLFEEIGRAGFDALELLVPETIEVNLAAFLVSIALDYATRSTFVHGEKALEFLQKLIRVIPKPTVRSILPGVSVAMTTLVSSKNKHQIVVLAIQILEYMWTNATLTEEDGEKMGELIERVFKQDLKHWKARRARVVLAGKLLGMESELLKDRLSPCIRCLFAGIADESESVKAVSTPIVEEIGGSLVISAEFEQCVEDLRRVARLPDDQKRLNLLQTISGLIDINKGKDNGFDAQVLTSLHPLASALVFVSEFQLNDSKIYEVGGGFIVRRRLYLPTELHMKAFMSILNSLPVDELIEILIDILNEAPNYAPEIFWMFGTRSEDGPTDLMMSVIEQANWWQTKEGNPRSVMTLEVVLEVTSKLCGTAMLQKLLYRVIECLASPHSSVEQTARAVLWEIAPEHDVAKLLMNNVDYITDRLIARMAFVDISPDVLTVFAAILSVDGDIADLLTHLMPRIYELLDTRDTFSLHILRLLPRVVTKLPAEAKNVIDRSIHFVLSPSVTVECAAMDAITAAIPLFENEEDLLPMVHQMWAPTLLIVKSVADCSNPAARRGIIIFETALIACRSFVRGRIRELLPLFGELINGNLQKLAENDKHVQAQSMLGSLLDILHTSLEPESIFDGLELEVFRALLPCFENGVFEEIQKRAVDCLVLLYKSSPAFVWALLLEVSGKYPEGELQLKASRYFVDVNRGVRLFIANLLQA